MAKYWYQIDRRRSDGTLDRYDMVQAKNLDDAIDRGIGDQLSSEHTRTRTTVLGRPMITVRDETETASYWEVQRVHE